MKICLQMRTKHENIIIPGRGVVAASDQKPISAKQFLGDSWLAGQKIKITCPNNPRGIVSNGRLCQKGIRHGSTSGGTGNEQER